jgi:hypothetical protein
VNNAIEVRVNLQCLSVLVDQILIQVIVLFDAVHLEAHCPLCMPFIDYCKIVDDWTAEPFLPISFLDLQIQYVYI